MMDYRIESDGNTINVTWNRAEDLSWISHARTKGFLRSHLTRRVPRYGHHSLTGWVMELGTRLCLGEHHQYAADMVANDEHTSTDIEFDNWKIECKSVASEGSYWDSMPNISAGVTQGALRDNTHMVFGFMDNVTSEVVTRVKAKNNKWYPVRSLTWRQPQDPVTLTLAHGLVTDGIDYRDLPLIYPRDKKSHDLRHLAVPAGSLEIWPADMLKEVDHG